MTPSTVVPAPPDLGSVSPSLARLVVALGVRAVRLLLTPIQRPEEESAYRILRRSRPFCADRRIKSEVTHGPPACVCRPAAAPDPHRST